MGSILLQNGESNVELSEPFVVGPPLSSVGHKFETYSRESIIDICEENLEVLKVPSLLLFFITSPSFGFEIIRNY